MAKIKATRRDNSDTSRKKKKIKAARPNHLSNLLLKIGPRKTITYEQFSNSSQNQLFNYLEQIEEHMKKYAPQVHRGLRALMEDTTPGGRKTVSEFIARKERDKTMVSYFTAYAMTRASLEGAYDKN